MDIGRAPVWSEPGDVISIRLPIRPDRYRTRREAASEVALSIDDDLAVEVRSGLFAWLLVRMLPIPFPKNRSLLKMVRSLIIAAFIGFILVSASAAQPARTILAIGAHAGDAELTSGAILAGQARQGDRVVILHMTLGEGGNMQMTPEEYGEQKRREAIEAARVLGAEPIFAPYLDGQLPDDEDVRRYVANVIREVKPTHVITHWKESIHKDHARTHRIVADAVLLAALPGVELEHPSHRGVRLFYAENWEDPEGFMPYLYVDVSEVADVWEEAVTKYEFVGGDISSFPYLDYYRALMVKRGAEARRDRAVALDIDPMGKKQIIDGFR